MLRLVNQTPFSAALMPGADQHGTEYAVVVVKGTFPIGSGPQRHPEPVEQLPVVWQDTHYGEPDRTSIKYAGDAALRKTGTDVYLVATAYAARNGVKMLDASVEVGSALKKSVRVIGDRKWYKSLGSWRISDPLPLQSMPVVYEKAFGGAAPAVEGSPGVAFDPRNPVGTGFAGKGPGSNFEGVPLPNVEDPQHPISTPKDRPAPAGFGAIGRGWEQRARWAGTMGDAWKSTRCPLLPADFDDRYYQAAHPDLIGIGHVQGGEPVRLTNLSPQGTQVFSLPRNRFQVTARIRGSETTYQAVLDTVLMEPDRARMVLSWRATIPCPRDFLHIEFAKIEEAV